MSYNAPRKPCRTPWRMSFMGLQLNLWQVPQGLSTHFLKLAHKPCCPPPPGILAQLLSKVEFSCQDAHRSPIQGSPDHDSNDNSAQELCWRSCHQKKFGVTPAQLKTRTPQSWNITKDIQVCSALLTLFIYKRHIYIDSVRRPCLFLSDHQMACIQGNGHAKNKVQTCWLTLVVCTRSPLSDAQAQQTSHATTKINMRNIKRWLIGNQSPYIWKHNVCTIINVTTKTATWPPMWPVTMP